MRTDQRPDPSAIPHRAFDPGVCNTTIFRALLAAARKHGSSKVVLEDAERQTLTYSRLILGSLVLGRELARETKHAENVGILMPTVNGLAVTVFGLNAFGRVAALLNFTSGLKNLRSAVQTGLIRTIVTSRRFVEAGKLDDLVAALEGTEIGGGKRTRVLYLEDVRKRIGTTAKLQGVVSKGLAGFVHARHALRPDQPAVVLFTSGTEGAPKGVVLSNRNLLANAGQIYAHGAEVISPADTLMNPLPMFHSFGLTAGTLMPLLNGVKSVLYPSPLHYKQVTKLVQQTKATILIATDTFLQGYARAAEPGDLATVRFVVAGAERVKDHTRLMWKDTGTTILEGYGATECSPVIACNIPRLNRPGSVGPMLPGMDARLEPVEGINEGGRLFIRGPNVMLGYIMADRPGIVQPPAGGWHDTGDIVTKDDETVIVIKGRAKRFAKIGGEMVSLAAVESMISGLWPESNHVVVSLPDNRKGEQLILVTEKPDADREALQKRARAEGFPELWMPRAVMVVGHIPVLGSGKVDLPATTEMVRGARALL